MKIFAILLIILIFIGGIYYFIIQGSEETLVSDESDIVNTMMDGEGVMEEG